MTLVLGWFQIIKRSREEGPTEYLTRILGSSVTRFGDYWILVNFLKPLATINLPKYPTLLGNFCTGVKIYHFYSEIIFGQFNRHLEIFSGHTAAKKILNKKFDCEISLVPSRREVVRWRRRLRNDSSSFFVNCHSHFLVLSLVLFFAFHVFLWISSIFASTYYLKKFILKLINYLLVTMFVIPKLFSLLEALLLLLFRLFAISSNNSNFCFMLRTN